MDFRNKGRGVYRSTVLYLLPGQAEDKLEEREAKQCEEWKTVTIGKRVDVYMCVPCWYIVHLTITH